MSATLVVRGHYSGRQFIPDEPLPDTEGVAELVITPVAALRRGSIAATFGKAPQLRSMDDVAVQIREERNAWGDR